MYEKYFHLNEAPFRLTSDHRFYFASSGHQKAMSYLTFGLSQGEGFVVITGDVGSGKTTLISRLLSGLDQTKFLTATLVSTQLNGDNILRVVAEKLGVRQEGLDKATLLGRLQIQLRNVAARGAKIMIVVDEAQNLPLSALEELRMLSNLVMGPVSALQLVLVGQPQFRVKMASPNLLQLRQRVVAAFHLGPISAVETGDYIQHRLKCAGWKNDPVIATDVAPAVHAASGGIPRLINVLFTRVLLSAFIEQNHHVTADNIQMAAQELQREFQTGYAVSQAG